MSSQTYNITTPTFQDKANPKVPDLKEKEKGI